MTLLTKNHLRNQTISSTARSLARETSAELARQGLTFSPNAVFVALLPILTSSAVGYWLGSEIILDDTFIYFRVVRNFLAGMGPHFNPDDPNMLATSPGWLLTLAAAKWLFPGVALPKIAKVLFIALLIIGSVLLFALLARRAPLLAALSPVAMFFAPSMAMLDGHDTALALTMNLAMLLSFSRRNRWFPVYVALAYLARGESLVLGGVLGLYLLFERPMSLASVTAQLRRLAPGIVVALTIITAWHCYYWHEFGQLLPTTIGTKILQGQQGWPLFAWALPGHFKLIAGPFRFFSWPDAVIGLLLLGLISAPLLLWPILHFALYSSLGVAHYPWYYYPIELTICLSQLSLVSFLVGAVVSRVPIFGRHPRTYLAVLACIWLTALLPPVRALVHGVHQGVTAFRTGNWWSTQHDARFDAYREISDWIAQYSDPTHPPILLSHEIGIIGYFLPRTPIYDVVGLATPVTKVEDLWNWEKFVKQYHPDLIIWPNEVTPSRLFGTNVDGSLNYYELAFRPSGGGPWALYQKRASP